MMIRLSLSLHLSVSLSLSCTVQAGGEIVDNHKILCIWHHQNTIDTSTSAATDACVSKRERERVLSLISLSSVLLSVFHLFLWFFESSQSQTVQSQRSSLEDQGAAGLSMSHFCKQGPCDQWDQTTDKWDVLHISPISVDSVSVSITTEISEMPETKVKV